MIDRYDSGLLSDFGGDVNWWQDYLRAELDHAHEFYQKQLENHKLQQEHATVWWDGEYSVVRHEYEGGEGWIPLYTDPPHPITSHKPTEYAIGNEVYKTLKEANKNIRNPYLKPIPLYKHPPASESIPNADEQELSRTHGMTLKQRIEHVGAHLDENDNVVFGSIMAVNAFVGHVIRDMQPSQSERHVVLNCTEHAPANNLPTWNSCAIRIGNEDYLRSIGAMDADDKIIDDFFADSLQPNPIHRFIYEYDDPCPCKSSWFMRRLELALNYASELHSKNSKDAPLSESEACGLAKNLYYGKINKVL
jgi:hypothetical protein